MLLSLYANDPKSNGKEKYDRDNSNDSCYEVDSHSSQGTTERHSTVLLS